MKTIFNILTLGLYSLLSKRKTLSQDVTKRKYRKDGTLAKEIIRETDYTEGDGLTNVPK